MSAYILPPVTAEAINTTDMRFGITDAMLISSTVPETPPATYSSGASYSLNARVSVGTAGGVIAVYQSKANANVNHTPSSSPDWWQHVGDTYAVWAAGVWAEGSRVIRVVPGTHSVYQRLAADAGTSSATLPEADTTRWARVETTNRWKMFDMLSDERTVSPVDITVVLAPGSISGLGVLDVEGGEAQMFMNVPGAGLVWDDIESLDGTYIGSWEDYFLAPFTPRSTLIRRDVPSYESGQLTVTLTTASGVLRIGRMVVGTVQEVGRLRKTPKVREKSFTTIDRDKYGTITNINKQRSIYLVSGSLLCPKHLLVNARAAFRLARTAPCVFIGLDNGDPVYSDLLTLPAICTDHDTDPAHSTDALINFELEGA